MALNTDVESKIELGAFALLAMSIGFGIAIILVIISDEKRGNDE